MKAHIFVQLKNGVLDPQAKAVSNALASLGFEGIGSVTMSKKITIELDYNDKQKAMQECQRMAQELLANLVIEDFNIQLED
ncbi:MULTISPECIES: phosphoribosylformylglycinamidine synthase subunit PurS [unclassified Helicobacter]|uniref:phosphoribosylformylglycinamidine synthase subunit PurS n=1 Tax=unclassified Helicobacter TaxID=2593540 RepID=UPI000CF0E367|nr:MULTISPECIES: phosphoribosylformylglycinamidine synthase subunit PurS [unclassified Helicobacter]